MYLSRYLKTFPSKQRPGHFLIYSTLRSSSVLVSRTTLEEASNGTLQGAQAETLKGLGVLIEDPALERERMRTLLERSNSKSRSFKAVVVLNLDCNLDCGYCYEGNFRRDQYMTEATAQLLAERLLREQIARGRDVSLTFYGGEPLLSESLINCISAPLQIAAKLYEVNYNFNLVTNGTLLNRQTAERLVPLGLNGAKFTLDGPREIHDRQRPFLSGAGSFDAIISNLAEVAELFPIVLGGNFLEENYREFPALLDHLLASGITPDKLSCIQFSAITPKAGCAEHSSGCASTTERWLMEAIPFLRGEILSRGYAVPKMKVSACVVEFADTLVVNHDGTLYKCPAFMGYDGLSIGTIQDGISDYGASHGIGNWQREQCLDCPYLPLCFGGCRFLNLLRGKPMTEVDCRREFLDATLEKFVLQNLAYQKK